MSNARQDGLMEIRRGILEQAKELNGTLRCYSLHGEKSEFDFTVIRSNNTRKNIKVYTAINDIPNTAISEGVLKKSKLDYIILYVKGEESDDTYVFTTDDVKENGGITTDGRKHFSTVLSNMEEYSVKESRNNLRRMFLEY